VSNPKYREIFEKLKDDITSGRYSPGSRLPTESELVGVFSVSRMTVIRAMRELQEQGLVTRRAGSGTYASGSSNIGSLVFGLLIPELGQTEIFEAICRGMMEAPQAKNHSLLWGSMVSANKDTEQVAEQLCQHFISQKVNGVFFAPLEFSEHRYQASHRIVTALDRAGITTVLLDRCFEPYPRRSKYDLVGIDNRRTGYMATEHLIKVGAKRIAFFAKPNSASTVDGRIEGYREAIISQQAQDGCFWVKIGDPSDTSFVKTILEKDHFDAFLCANDNTAGNLMQTLMSIGKDIPGDIRIVGIDDVKYARMLPVPLTTQHQPCLDIGKIALAVMLDRIADPSLPPRDILLGTDLVIRQSCGSLQKPA
jgi:DNA-binding LacI/PurR family transcriptional regulator